MKKILILLIFILLVLVRMKLDLYTTIHSGTEMGATINGVEKLHFHFLGESVNKRHQWIINCTINIKPVLGSVMSSGHHHVYLLPRYDTPHQGRGERTHLENELSVLSSEFMDCTKAAHISVIWDLTVRMDCSNASCFGPRCKPGTGCSY